jgi:alpha-tubulin suppressor-like RCC1 family protein
MRSIRTPVLFLILSVSYKLFAAQVVPGRVVGCGDNTAGAVTGLPGSPSDRPNHSTGVVTIEGQALTNVTAISAGGNHGLALRADGTVVGWGFNYYGQATGATSRNNTNGPVAVAGQTLSNVTAIAAGQDYSLALKSDGRVVGWGKTGSLSGQSNIVGITAGGRYDAALALRNDGTVVRLSTGTPVLGLSNIASIATGRGDYWPNLALRSDGTVLILSENTDHGPADPPGGLSNVVAVAAGSNHNLVVRRDGTVVGWGFNGEGQATGTPTHAAPFTSDGVVRINSEILSNVVAVAASDEFSVALKRDGKIVAWGKNYFHQTDVPAELAGIVAIAAGQSFCLALTTNNNALFR